MASELETLSNIEGSGHLNPIQSRRLTELRSMGSSGNIHGIIGGAIEPGMGGLGGSSDVLSMAKQLQQFQKESVQPAVSSLEASIPETSARFATDKNRLEGEKTTLKDRYKGILDEITRRETVDVSAQERVTSREFGRRGIPLSSGIFDTTLQEQVSPLRQFYAGQAKEAGLGQEEGLRGIENLIAQLTGQETGAIRDIRNTIAQLQSSGGPEAISGALNLLGLRQNEQEGQKNRDLQQRLAEINNQPDSMDPFKVLGEGSTLFNLLTGQPMFTAPKTYKPEDGGSGETIDFGNLFNEFRGGR